VEAKKRKKPPFSIKKVQLAVYPTGKITPFFTLSEKIGTDPLEIEKGKFKT
jgi:hypothetical protein